MNNFSSSCSSKPSEIQNSLQFMSLNIFPNYLPLASIIRNNFDVNFLQHIRHRSRTMSNSAPTCNSGHFSNQFRARWWKTNWQDVLLELNVTVQFHQRNIVLEITWRIIRMNFFSFYQIFFVRQSLVCIFHVVFT